MSLLESLTPYQRLCTEYYDLDKPTAPPESLAIYTEYATKSKGPILEPMCGTGRYLIPLLKLGHNITGFDSSSYMVDVCQRKLRQENLYSKIAVASFETFSFQGLYGLIMIPTSSFCLLTTNEAASIALKFVVKHMAREGKFIFEVDTPKSVNTPQGVWKGSWVNKSDGSKLVLNTVSRFNAESGIDEILCRYEFWQDNMITKTEVEDFRLRLYEMREIEALLEEHNLVVVNKWLPHSKITPDDQSQTVLYECIKL